MNKDPYSKGWILIISPTNLEEESTELMNFDQAMKWYKEETPKKFKTSQKARARQIVRSNQVVRLNEALPLFALTRSRKQS